MNQMYYPLSYKNSVNRWLVTDTLEEQKSFKPITMDFTGDLNRWLTEGFAIFENPNRKVFIDAEKKEKKEKIDLTDVYPGKSLTVGSTTYEWNLHFPWNNKKIEKSGFWQKPTLLKTWAVTTIRSTKLQKASFKLFTCGNVVLWINGEKVLQFSPYTRNEEKSIQFEALLQEGNNEFLVLFEDLAERDALYYFQLDYLGHDELEMVLPIGEANPNDIYLLEEALSNAYFPSDVVKSGDINLIFENPLIQALNMECNLKTVWWGEKREFIRSVTPGSKSVLLGKAEDIGMANALLKLSIRYHSVVIQKDIFIQVYPESLVPANAPESILERKQEALSLIADHGNNNMHRAYALAKTGRQLDLVESIVRDTLHVINERFDCSDFYYNQLFRFWIDFRDSQLFDDSFWEECKQAILNYRYWFDEPGDDVMWYFSENHALLFHTCEYLAGQLFPNERFTNANVLGEVHVEKAKSRLVHWFEKYNRELLAEWNSSYYIPINLMGFLAIYDLVNDVELKNLAKKALDDTFRLMAINSYKGYLSCSQGRIYEKDLKGNYNNATTSLLWIAYGKGNLNNSTYATVSLCVSDYQPPNYNAYISLDPEESIIFKNHQGPDNFVDLYTFKNSYGLLSSAVEYRPGHRGYSEHVIHSIVSPEAVIWINHPGEEAELGTGRPSFWAGNGILPKVDQYQDIAIVHYNIDPLNDIAYTHAYFPIAAFEQTEITNNWIFGKKGDSYVALYAKNGIEQQTKGQNQNREFISRGRENTWIIRNSNVLQFADFSQFKESVLEAEIIEIQEEFKFNDPIHGVVQSSWQGPFFVDGEVQLNRNQKIEGVIEKWSLIRN
jgi:hypothetical protein